MICSLGKLQNRHFWPKSLKNGVGLSAVNYEFMKVLHWLPTHCNHPLLPGLVPEMSAK